MSNVAVLIPVLDPDEKFVSYISALADFGFENIIVVNDGSGEEYEPFFDETRKYPGCVVLNHEINRGKGRALKTGLSYFKEHLAHLDGVVTGDADGQHTLKDTAALAAILADRKDALVLGVRDFSLAHVPRRSMFGNRVTSVVFKLLYGQYISDTQTGLRGIPAALVDVFLATDGERFDYETNMLVECADRGIPIIEHPIETVYIEDNKSSHFRPVRDSAKVYWLLCRNLIKFVVSGGLSFLINVGVFWLASAVLPGKNYTPFHTAAGFILSSVFNFLFNEYVVFAKRADAKRSAARFVTLVACNWAITTVLIWVMRHIFNPGKLLDNLLFTAVQLVMMLCFTYPLSRRWVFKKD
ncbi:MAG: bifunctional glycosyltransferase family 2/GtrA family protein [Oscillospiraceae bacterium]|nr:bifunctional glycosyltransferase family 2/GtrA family protein [Oscillospiraceae bacterium]